MFCRGDVWPPQAQCSVGFPRRHLTRGARNTTGRANQTAEQTSRSPRLNAAWLLLRLTWLAHEVDDQDNGRQGRPRAEDIGPQVGSRVGVKVVGDRLRRRDRVLRVSWW